MIHIKQKSQFASHSGINSELFLWKSVTDFNI